MPVRAAARTPVILVVGDSLSAEYGLPRGSGWVALLERRLAQQRISAQVVNASISGETSAGGRWNFLAAWGYAYTKDKDAEKANAFVGQLYKNVPVLDTGARGSTVTFVERGVGDVLLAWENEAFLALREFGPDKFEIVAPAQSILAEPPVAVVDTVADKKGTRAVAEAYLKYWYTKEGQEIAARNSYRPRDPEIAKEYEKSFAKVELFTIDDVFGGWTKAQKEHFAEGGIFDQIYKN